MLYLNITGNTRFWRYVYIYVIICNIIFAPCRLQPLLVYTLIYYIEKRYFLIKYQKFTTPKQRDSKMESIVKCKDHFKNVLYRIQFLLSTVVYQVLKRRTLLSNVLRIINEYCV